jgi:hypothetical protein
MDRRIAVVAVLTVVLMLSLTGAAAAGKWPDERQGFFLGLNLGGGTAGADVSTGDVDREGGVAGNFRVGYAFQDQFGLGLETAGWAKEVDGDWWSYSVSGLGFTFWPSGKGFHIRGVIGSGSVSYSSESGGVTTTISDSGLGLSGGIGYEIRLAKKFALGPHIDYNYADVNDDLSVDFVNFTVGANWYF